MNPSNDDEQLQKDAEAVWNSEVSTLDEISGLKHDNLIQRIAGITRGKQRYLMFLWADGGNLRDFWEANPKPKVTAGLVKDIIQQLRGMADALDKLHNYKGHRHYRHGDIKPENILNFPDADKSGIGTFKISDLGSAKSHAAATRLRGRTAGNKFATVVYQAPEAITQKAGSTSRLYDIWSMGCVTLEFMVWLLYGYEELQEFKKRIIGPYGEACSFFISRAVEEVQQEGIITKQVAQIHPAVQNCLDRLSSDKECADDTALGDLLEIVKTKLLVIALPERTESSIDHESGENISVTNADGNSKRRQPFGGQRATAGGFANALDGILESKNASKGNYWFTGRSRDNLRLSVTIPEIITEDNPKSSLFVGWTPLSGQNPVAHRAKDLSLADRSSSLTVTPGQGQNQDVGAH
jgi:serine/threonine protein kinase